MRYLCVAAVLVSLTACRVDFDGDGPGQYQENFHESFKVDASARLSLDNENGGVEISSWEKNEVEVNAVKFASSEAQLKDVKIERDQRSRVDPDDPAADDAWQLWGAVYDSRSEAYGVG